MKWNFLSYLSIFLAGSLLALYGDPFHIQIALGIVISIILGISWDILGRTGQTSFGHSAFFGIGAYVTAIFYAHVGVMGSWVISILLSMALAFVFGMAVLRLRGLYFAISTLSLSLALQVLTLVFASVTGGGTGISPHVIFGGDRRLQLLLCIGFLVVAMIISDYFLRSQRRAAAFLIRSNPQLALSSGIPIVYTKVLAFCVSGAIAALAGGLYGGLYGFILPADVFNVHWNVLPLAIALLGGVDSTLGPIIGGVLIRFSEEFAKEFIGGSGYQIVLGGIIILCITVMPKGILGLLKRLIYGFSKLWKRS